MNDDLKRWIEKRVDTSWISTLPEHCLSDRYQSSSAETGRVPILPSFVKRVPAFEEDISEAYELHWEYRHPANRDVDVKRVQLIRETRNEFAEPLSTGNQEDRRQAYADLLRQEKSMLDRAEKLGGQIDEQFQATDPSTGERSSLVDQARILRRKLRQLKEKHDSDTKLRQVVSAEMEQRKWRPRADASSSVSWAAAHPPHEAHSLLKPLSESPLEERVCISVQDMGVDCGLEWLPAEATLEQAEKLSELYFEDIQDRADELGNAHALLTFRLYMLQMALREYELYGRVETWEIGEVAEIPRWEDMDIDESKYEVDIHDLLCAIEAILADSGKRESVWHLDRDGCPVNFRGLHDQLLSVDEEDVPLSVSERGNPLFKGDSRDPISRQWLTEVVDKFFNRWHLEVLRREAGIDHPWYIDDAE